MSTMSRPLVILGTGGSAYDILDVVEAINRVRPTWHVAGFLDDARPVGSQHLDLPILGSLAQAKQLEAECLFINAIGSDSSYRIRPKVIESTRLPRERFASLVHPAASVSSFARIGSGVYVCHGASIGGAAVLGDHVSLSPGVIIGHDAVIEAYALLAPAAVVSGFCTIGHCSYLGAGCSIRQRVRTGDFCLVGMGSVVLQNVEPGTTVVGNPAKALLHNGSGTVRVARGEVLR